MDRGLCAAGAYTQLVDDLVLRLFYDSSIMTLRLRLRFIPSTATLDSNSLRPPTHHNVRGTTSPTFVSIRLDPA
jgi:hypothetical protein